MYFDYDVLAKYDLVSRINLLILSLDWNWLFDIQERTRTPVTYKVQIPRGKLKSWTDKVIQF